jgi:ABC-2 type transport system ATP-binding protein
VRGALSADLGADEDLMSDAAPMITLDHVTRLYGPVIGVNDLVLEIPPGAYGLVGPNGSGKSTLLHLLTGQLRPTIGTVRVFGRDPFSDAPTLASIGLCPERDVLHPRVTGLEWVTALTALYGFTRAEARERALDMLQRVGLTEAMNRRILTYSRGMRARVKIAQSLAHDPDQVILDEPFNGLDPVGRHEIKKFLREWVDSGRSLLIASHVLQDVEALANAFLLMYRGRLLASGQAADIRALLADVPHDVHLRGPSAHALATRAIESGSVDGVRFDSDGQGVHLHTLAPLDLYARLPEWAGSDGIAIEEIRGGDTGLEDLFLSLVRVHRGEGG